MGKKRITGRNYKCVTIYHRGGAKKKNFRIVDYLRYVWNIPGIVLRREYDPNRKIILNLVGYANGFLTFLPSIIDVHVGSKIISSSFLLKHNQGCSTYLCNFGTGSLINNIELLKNMGGVYARSMGAFVKIISKQFNNKVLVRLRKTRKLIKLNPFSVGTLGVLYKSKIHKYSLNKASYTLRLGWRPNTRGYAKNPVDHPHGGRTKKGLQVSLWGKHTKGKKTKVKKSYYEVEVKR